MEAASTLAGESSKRLSPDQQKVFQNALQEYIAAMEYSGDFAFGRYNLAMLYNGRGENDKAERLFRDVVAKHPELYDVAYSLGLLLAEMGKHKEGRWVIWSEQPKACRSVPGSNTIWACFYRFFSATRKPKRRGGAFFKAAFQGNNLVYVVVEKSVK